MITAVQEIWVTVVADHATRRRDLQRALDGDEGIAVVATDATGAETAEVTAATQPARDHDAVVVIDFSHSAIRDKLALVEAIATRPDPPGIVVVGARADDAIQALMRGASGVVAQGATPGELCESVKVVSRGEAAVPPDVTRALVARLQRLDPYEGDLLTAGPGRPTQPKEPCSEAVA